MSTRYWGRTVLAVAHDAIACAATWYLAAVLRMGFDMPAFYVHVMLTSMPWAVALYLALFRVLGLYRGIWRYASLTDLKRIVWVVALGAALTGALMFMLRIPVPRVILVLHPLMLMTLMAGSRLAYRGWKEHRLDAAFGGDREPVLVLGGADAAERLIRELARSSKWRVAGVLDDDPAHHGRQLHGIEVFGALSDLASFAERLEVKHAIIAMPEASHRERRRAVELCREADVEALTVPAFDDLMSGRVTVAQVRNVELDDLLGRDPVLLDTAGLRGLLGERVVMVTGAGGSIGSELCRQISRYAPRRLVLFEANEFALYSIEQEFRDSLPAVDIVCAIGDVRDRTRVEQVLRAHKPYVVFHAAAYKHVPLMEAENAWQAVQNNVLATRVVGEAAIANGVEKFVLISTDKAVNPVNVMGATKRLAEMVCQALQRHEGTRFVIVRFGNVLGSTGSVIPRFRAQIARGGPLTVTHPDITRYFMSIPEAVQLVLQAALMGSGGEIFVLDMGEPVRIADLARDMIRLSGLEPEDVPIEYTGLRPGEKLFEEPLAKDENTLPTPHAKLRIAAARQQDSRWLVRLSTWLERSMPLGDEAVKVELAQWVPEYRPAVDEPPARAAS